MTTDPIAIAADTRGLSGWYAVLGMIVVTAAVLSLFAITVFGG
jgi:hypothetical protein